MFNEIKTVPFRKFLSDECNDFVAVNVEESIGRADNEFATIELVLSNGDTLYNNYTYLAENDSDLEGTVRVALEELEAIKVAANTASDEIGDFYAGVVEKQEQQPDKAQETEVENPFYEETLELVPDATTISK
jgi:hypothetical protein